jgi:cyclic nucleotide-binding protein
MVWSTLALTIRADGSSDFEVVGASSFPRHWIYDHAGRLAAKTGLIDFHKWHLEASPQHSPWGDEESPALVTAVESALERQLSRLIIGAEPPFRRLRPSQSLVKQGEPGDELFLLFDGVLAVEVDGETITEVGPGAILGEMALLQGGRRTATLRAVTPCRVAVVPGERIDRQALEELARGRTPDATAPGGGSSPRVRTGMTDRPQGKQPRPILT